MSLRSRTVSPRGPAPRAVVGLVLAGVVLTGCGGTSDASMGTSRGERVTAIRTAREVVSGPLVQLGSAAERVVVDLESVATSGESPEQLQAATDAVEEDSIPALRREVEAVSGLDLTGEVLDLRVAQRSLDAAVGAAAAIADAAVAELDDVRRGAVARAEIEGLAAQWAEPGSFSQQLEHLAALAAEAVVVADDLEAAAGRDGSCADRIGTLADVARRVAGGSRELADLVRNRQGVAFDERRRELTETVTAAAAEAAPSETCWREHSNLSALQEHLQGAIADLEGILNPEELSGETTA